MGGNIPGGNFLGGNFPGGNFPGGSLLGGNIPGENFPGGIFLEIIRILEALLWLQLIYFLISIAFWFVKYLFRSMETL